MDYKRADFGIFKGLLSRVPWDRTVEGRAAQKGWMILKSCLLQVQLQCLPRTRRRHLYTGIKCTFSKFANDTNWYDVINTLEGRDAVERDLDRFER